MWARGVTYLHNGVHSSAAAPPLSSRRPAACACTPLGRRARRVLAAAVNGGGEGAGAVQQVDEEQVEGAARAGWDPEGLFSSAKPLAEGKVDLFALREQRRAAQQQQQQQQQQQAAAHAEGAASSNGTTAASAPATAAAQSSIPAPASTSSAATASTAAAAGPAVAQPPAPPAPAPPLQQQPQSRFADPPVPAPLPGGVPANTSHEGYSPDAYAEHLRAKFMGVALQRPGVNILHMDPPVITIDDFLSPEVCEQLMAAAEASGCLQTSKIGAGNASAAVGGENNYDSRRTSSSMLVDPTVRRLHPEVAKVIDHIQQLGWELLEADGGREWGATGRMPGAGQYCYESPQVARYEMGQHFLSHEDAFPGMIAQMNGFQRHATLLIYLNHVPQGGHTRFDHLGLSVQPKQGKALLFFPSYSNGKKDERTLHTAEDATDPKWVMQQWVVRGWGQPKAPKPPKQQKKPAVVQETVTVPVADAGSGGGGGAKGKGGKGKGGKKGKRGFK